jgi:hypothetical protein
MRPGEANNTVARAAQRRVETENNLVSFYLATVVRLKYWSHRTWRTVQSRFQLLELPRRDAHRGDHASGPGFSKGEKERKGRRAAGSAPARNRRNESSRTVQITPHAAPLVRGADSAARCPYPAEDSSAIAATGTAATTTATTASATSAGLRSGRRS